MFRWLRQRVLRFRKEAVVLAYAVRDPDTPTGLRLASLLAAAYLLSPIDLIPITIPGLGLLDDLVIVPWITSSVSARLPPQVQARAGAKADGWIRRWFKRPLLILGVLAIGLIAIWATLLWLLYRWIAG